MLKHNMMTSKKLIASFMVLLLLFSMGVVPFSSKKAEAALDPDIQAKLDSYNVAFTTPNTLGSAGSMPIGNGDITLNVWTESNGDLLFYIGKSDTWSEATRLLKLGRVRVKISPNPFATGNAFSQILKLRQGEILITAGPVGQQVTLRAWVDANQPVIRIEASGEQPFQIDATTEIWRNSVISMNDSTKHSYYGIASSGVSPNPSESADQVLPRTNEILWYHRNSTSLYYQKTLDAQHLGGLASKYPDPYLNSTFGAAMKGTNMVPINNTTLRSSSNGTNFVLSVYPYTATTDTVDTWESQLNTNITNIEATDIETARTNHINWWSSFWDKSWVFVTGDANATTVTRGYLLQRFMEAIQGRGKYAIKFNGGTINFDYEGQNADYRLWGPVNWWQNIRLLYWPMLQSGDYEMMLPMFNEYKNKLNIQMDVTKQYYNHDGAFFPEVSNFYGLSNIDNFQYNSSTPNPGNDALHPSIKYYWQGGIELSAMMLEYYDYTKDDAFASNTLIPVVEQIIKFYDQHYPKVNGIIKIDPAQILETYPAPVTNPTPEIAGLRSITPKLLALPTTLTTQAQRDEWQNFLNALPPIPTGTNANSETILKPAETYSTANLANENGEEYAIFPYKVYGLGKPDLEMAIRTFNARQFQTGSSITDCWHYDSILAAYLGLTAKAKAEVIDKFSNYSSLTAFPAFWNKMDWIPDLDNGAVAMNALQTMILQSNGNEIRLLPSWPSSWNVDFKLHATGNTTVRGKYENGEVTLLQVTPAERLIDVINPDKTKDLQGYWKLDETVGTSVYDSSGKNKTGTVNGGATWVAGKSNNGLSFNGTNSYVNIPDSFDPTDYTVSMWVKPASITAQSIFLRTNANGGTVSVSHQLRINASGKFEAFVSDGAAKTVTGTTQVVPNTWYHIAMVASSGGQMKLFVNGKPEGTPVSIGTLWTGGDRYWLGSNSNGFGWYKGLADEVMVYGSVLSDSDIAAFTSRALNKTATQSSTINGGVASRAVDGNTDGVWNNSSVTQTDSTAQAWWMVDLGSSFNINDIKIFNRTDCCSDQLSDYNILILDDNQNQVWSNHQTTFPSPSTTVNAGGTTGRYVKIQLTGTNSLSLSEVQVFGDEVPTTPTPDFTDGFESGFGNWTTISGTPSTGTPAIPRGNSSFVLDQDLDAIQHSMAATTNQVGVVWFYDDSTDNTMKAMTFIDKGTSSTVVGLGVDTATSATKYVYRVGSSNVPTAMNRTTGWHSLAFDYRSGTDVKLYIDGTQVFTSTAQTGFNLIRLGDFWGSGETGTVYYDDISVQSELP